MPALDRWQILKQWMSHLKSVASELNKGFRPPPKERSPTQAPKGMVLVAGFARMSIAPLTPTCDVGVLVSRVVRSLE